MTLQDYHEKMLQVGRQALAVVVNNIDALLLCDRIEDNVLEILEQSNLINFILEDIEHHLSIFKGLITPN